MNHPHAPRSASTAVKLAEQPCPILSKGPTQLRARTLRHPPPMLQDMLIIDSSNADCGPGSVPWPRLAEGRFYVAQGRRPLQPSHFLIASTRWRSLPSIAPPSRRSAGGEPGAPMPTRLAAGPGSPLGTLVGRLQCEPVVPYTLLNQRAAPSSLVED